MTANSHVITGPVRRPLNMAAHITGSIHDDATATALGFRGGTVAGRDARWWPRLQEPTGTVAEDPCGTALPISALTWAALRLWHVVREQPEGAVPGHRADHAEVAAVECGDDVGAELPR